MQNFKSKVKTFTFLLVILTSHFLLFPSTTFAHVLQSSGSVGAVMHINPEDDPIVGEPASFFFEFKDKQGKFKPENCDCTFAIVEAGKQIYSQPLFQNSINPSLSSASVFYTFPQKDVYTVKVSGKPYTADGFQPFTLEYDIRVTRQANAQTVTQNGQVSQKKNWISGHIIHLVAAFVFLFFVVITFVKQKVSKPNV